MNSSKKTTDLSQAERLHMIDKYDPCCSVRAQCDMLDVSRSRYYYQAMPHSKSNVMYMNILDR